MIIKLLIGWGIVSIISIALYSMALAASGDLDINYTPDPGGGLFYRENIKPGDTFLKQVAVENKSDEVRQFATKIDKLLGDPMLGEALTLEVSRGSALILTTHLSDIVCNETNVEEIPGNTTYVYDFKVTMDNVGNEYQGKRIEDFGYILGFVEDEEGRILGEKDSAGLLETGPSILIPLFLSAAAYIGLRKKFSKQS